MGLSKGTSAKILWRSLFIQGAWNFKGMQNIGFVYAMLPGLKKVHSADVDGPAAKYLNFFNTHPYMAPTIAGVFLKLEGQGDGETIEKLKPTISGSLAALGDTFFWASLKPIVALLLLLTVMADHPWGIVPVLLLYNGVHFWIMAWGFNRGYRNGPGGALELGGLLSIKRTKRMSYSIPLLAGMALAALSLWKAADVNLGMSLLIFIGALAAFRLRLGVFWIFYGVFTLSLVWTIIQ